MTNLENIKQTISLAKAKAIEAEQIIKMFRENLSTYILSEAVLESIDLTFPCLEYTLILGKIKGFYDFLGSVTERKNNDVDILTFAELKACEEQFTYIVSIFNSLPIRASQYAKLNSEIEK